MVVVCGRGWPWDVVDRGGRNKGVRPLSILDAEGYSGHLIYIFTDNYSCSDGALDHESMS